MVKTTKQTQTTPSTPSTPKFFTKVNSIQSTQTSCNKKKGRNWTLLLQIYDVDLIRGNLGSKMGLIRKHANNKLCELEFKNQ